MNKEVKQALMHLKIMTKDDKGCEAALELIENELNEDEEYESELITEQHRLFDLANKQENELQKIKEQYKNIHNTKVKVPLYNILNGLSRAERERVIEDIYYSQAENDNKISKLENELDVLQEFAKIIVEKYVNISVIICCVKYDVGGINFYNRNLSDEEKLTQAEFDLVEKVVKKICK